MSFLDKAKEALGKNSDKANEGVDKAAEFAKSKFGDHGDQIDQASDKAKDFVNKQGTNDDPQPGQ
jgi:ABC-type transporter Mla subunit MlaD